MPDYDQRAAIAAYRVKQILDREFGDAPTEIRDQAPNIVFQRLQRMIHGEQLNIEGPGLVTEVPEPPAEEPPKEEPVPETDK